MTLVMASAFLCVFSRAILNIFDRKIFKQADTDFWKSLTLNAVFPFSVATFIAYTFGQKNAYFFDFILQPGIIFSALGAQTAAYVISSSLRSMPVRSVVVSSKIADLFIPFFTFCITGNIKINDYIFSSLTTLIFIPIIISLIKQKSHFSVFSFSKILLILICQASINSYFCMHTFTNTWPKFLSMMSCILFWRSFFMFITLSMQSINKLKSDSQETISKKVNYILLFFRAFLAFTSQAAFFYSIAGISSAVAWPILNSTPFVTSFSAHLFLNERVGRLDLAVMCLFLTISMFYLYIQGGAI